MPKTGGYYQSILAYSVNFVSKWDFLTFIVKRSLVKTFLSSFIQPVLLHHLFVQHLFPGLFSCHLQTHSHALVYQVGFYILIILWASFQVAWKKKNSQYEFMKQCMNKSFPALNTPLSKWSRGFSRTIYITVADTVFKFSCQSQNGILNHPIFLNEVREF